LHRVVTTSAGWLPEQRLEPVVEELVGPVQRRRAAERGRHSFDFYCDVKTACERTSAFSER
jgi:hypothetical protein